MGYELLATGFNIALVQGLAATGQFPSKRMTLVDEAIRRVETNGDELFMPELLRLKGALLLALPQRRVDEAEKCCHAVAGAEPPAGRARLGACAPRPISAALWAEQGERKKARELLRARVRAIRGRLETLRSGKLPNACWRHWAETAEAAPGLELACRSVRQFRHAARFRNGCLAWSSVA